MSRAVLYSSIRHSLRGLAGVTRQEHGYPPLISKLARVIGYLKGKSVIAVARQFGDRKRNFNGEKLWAGGYAVSTVGFEEKQIRNYIHHQDHLDGKDDGLF